YTPASAGKWARGDVAYRRELPYYHVRHVRRTLEWLEAEHPRYLWTDPATGLRFSHVPVDAVARHYLPECRLADIVAAPRDALERESRDLAMLLAGASGLSVDAFGVSGSILLGLHDPAFSDIDLLIYGAESARRVQAVVDGLGGEGLVALPEDRRARWREETAARFGLDGDAVANLEARRWHYRLFRGRYVSLHPTRADDEIREAYGDRRYTALGRAVVEARVVDASEAMFLPAVYRVAGARWLEGEPGSLDEIVSFEGLYCNAADEGERILAIGHLEAERAGGRRLVVGSGFLPDGGSLRVWR
ncbi:MAG TPA: nucleotidyltransferase domain-containing protein, partial [Thermoanaerobaculia bacterium]